MSALPTSRAFLTSLFNAVAQVSLSTAHRSGQAQPDGGFCNFKSQATPELRSLLLTLHCIFPNQLLPALDVLDRQLVTRLSHTPPPVGSPETLSEGARNLDPVFYVTSSVSSQRSGRYQGLPASVSHYEVRLGAWCCSCAAFILSAMSIPPPETHPSDDEPDGIESRDKADKTSTTPWQFGGLSLGEGEVPVCKHLLACLLAEQCSFLVGFVKTRETSLEEMAGWASGWGG